MARKPELSAEEKARRYAEFDVAMANYENEKAHRVASQKWNDPAGGDGAVRGSDDPNRGGEISPTRIPQASGGPDNPWANPLTVERFDKRADQAGFLRNAVAQEARRILNARLAEVRQEHPRLLDVSDVIVFNIVVDNLTLTHSKWEDRTYVDEIARLSGVVNSTVRKALHKLATDPRLTDQPLLKWKGKQGKDKYGHGKSSTVGVPEWAREAAKAAYLASVNGEV